MRTKNPDVVKDRAVECYMKDKNGVQAFYDEVKNTLPQGQMKKILANETIVALLDKFAVQR